jgi:hypothetical protein
MPVVTFVRKTIHSSQICGVRQAYIDMVRGDHHRGSGAARPSFRLLAARPTNGEHAKRSNRSAPEDLAACKGIIEICAP